jgi:hypothetical protein
VAEASNPNDVQNECTRRFIDLANAMKDEGVPTNVVAWSLMTACSTYSIYSVVGNDGGLNPSGIDKLTDAFKDNLTKVQGLRRKNQEQAQREAKQTGGESTGQG